jgi:hypothetical protein
MPSFSRFLIMGLLALVLASPAAAAVRLELSRGAGYAAVGTRGALLGNVRKGKVVVTRLTYGGAPAGGSYVRGCERARGRLRTRFVCRGSYLRLYVHGGRWLVTLRGFGINVRGFVAGRLSLRNGTAGTYWVEGNRRRQWPADRKVIRLSAANNAAWRNIVNDQFDRGGIPTHWRLYGARYGSTGNCAAPSHVSVSGGYLRMLMGYETNGACGSGWYTGGMALSKQAPYYGIDQRITVRWRVIMRGVVSHRIIPMRWPVNASNWPMTGEEDYCEGHSNARCSTFLHYSSRNLHVDRRYTVDLTQWHTMRFERRRYILVAYIDNMATPVWTYLGSPRTLPATKKLAVLQQECPPPSAGGCPPGTAGSEEIQIDWIKIDNPT